MSWCTIESDPGVFNEMIANLGVRGVSVEEIYSLDEAEQASNDSPSYGLVFLFKYRQERDARPCVDPSMLPDLFFARQTVPNACATQAILSVLLNAQGIDIGSELTEFKSFALALDSESRGFAIGGSDMIRTVHNSFARSEPFLTEESRASLGEKEDVYHFVAYLPFQGQVYEVDGLKPGPILLGEAGANWLKVAKPAVEARMQRYANTETTFALLSIRPKKSILLENEISSLQERLMELSVVDDEDVKEVSRELQSQLDDLKSQLEYELSLTERQRQENIRRRHNYFPLIMCLLKHLSRKNLLQPMVDAAVANHSSQPDMKRKKLEF